MFGDNPRFGDRMLAMRKRPRAMILAAGLGTRLGAVGLKKPKPMMPVCGEPLVKWVVLWLRSQGVREIVINLHHLGDQIKNELGNGSVLGVDIHYSHEREILGTGGGILAARSWLDDGHGSPIVVVNGKILVDLDLTEVLEQHKRSRSEATLVLRKDREKIWGANIEIDQGGKILDFLGHRRDLGANRALSGSLMFSGIHVLSPAFLDRIPQQASSCIIRDTYIPAYEAGLPVYGWIHHRYWWEHSTVFRYVRGVRQVLSGKAELSYRLGPLRYRSDAAHVHQNVQIDAASWIGCNVILEEGVRIGPGTQIGSGTRVRKKALLENCVIWPNSDVSGKVHDCVVTREGMIVSANSGIHS